jgi:D-alanyl-D-alanine dipeptidase
VSAHQAAADRRLADVPIRECGEPLVDLGGVASLRVDPNMARTSPTGGLVRATVVDRLVTAQSLLPRGLRLLVLDGLRDEALLPSRQADRAVLLRGSHPDWPMQQILDEAGWECSPADPAAHQTGGAVDVTLCTETGDPLPMGCPPHAGPVASNGACHTDAPVPARARANREAMRQALTAAGLVNLPEAWWHWSYGDRFWSYVTGAPSARYGSVPSALLLSPANPA